MLTCEELKKRIFDECKHPECGKDKSGVIYKSAGAYRVTITDCRCMARFRREVRYLTAGVPERLWSFDYNDLLPTFIDKNARVLGQIKLWTSNITDVLSTGASLHLFSGDSGSGKSALASVIIRTVLDVGLPALWVRGTDLFDRMLKEDDRVAFLDGVSRARMVVLDDIDSIYIPDAQRNSFLSIVKMFSILYDNQIPVVATSGVPISGMPESYPRIVRERMAEWDELELRGVDHRKRKSKMGQYIKNEEARINGKV